MINRDAIEAMVQDAVRPFTREAMIARLEKVGVPCGPVNTIKDIFSDPFVEARSTVHRFRRDDGVEIPTVAFPGKLSATPAEYRHQPPHVGENTRDLLREWLALNEAELDSLEHAGTIAQRKN